MRAFGLKNESGRTCSFRDKPLKLKRIMKIYDFSELSKQLPSLLIEIFKGFASFFELTIILL